MLSSVLRSDRAVEVNIVIMRVFVRLRRLISTHKEIAAMLKDIEDRLDDHDDKFKAIFEAINELLTPPPPDYSGDEMGFRLPKTTKK